MIKKCKVILQNQYVSVVDCDTSLVQFPHLKSKNDFVYVDCSADGHKIVSKEEYEKSLKTEIKKQTKKTKDVKRVDIAETTNDESDEILK